MKSLKIAFCNRPEWNNPLGGDGIQMLKTKEALEKLYNVEIEIITSPELLDARFNLVHIFNFATFKITKDFFEKSVKLALPIVSSCIYWDYTFASERICHPFIRDHFSVRTAKWIRMFVKISGNLFGYPKLMSRKFKKELRYFVEKSRVILPNSEEEGHLVLEFIGKQHLSSKFKVVYNATEFVQQSETISEQDFLEKYHIPNNYILQVGRIETIKNQLNLVYALLDKPQIPIVFVGKISEQRYFEKLARLAERRGNVYFVNAVPHEEVCLFYKYAQLHVLLSLRESPGLVSLEALSNGCPIVISTDKYVPVSTYFPSQPYVVDPFDIKKIRQTILKAYGEHRLVDEGLNRFTWEHAAQQTMDAYCIAIKDAR